MRESKNISFYTASSLVFECSVQHYIFKILGIRNDGLGLDYFIHDKDVVNQKDIPISHLHGYIGIVIGAAHNTKKLPVHKLKELCSKINHPVILLGGKEDYSNAG